MDIGLWHNNDNDGPWSRIRPLQHRNCAIEIATAFEMEYETQQRDALFIISEAKYEAYLTMRPIFTTIQIRRKMRLALTLIRSGGY